MPPYSVNPRYVANPTPASSDPMNAQTYTVTNPQRPEDLAQPLYDRVQYPVAGTNQLSFFSTQLGQTANLIQAQVTLSKVKTLRDTNLGTSGVVPTKLFQFIGISVVYIPKQQALTQALTGNIGDDIMRLKNGGWMNFTIIDKPILQMPLVLLPEANPIIAVSQTVNSSVFLGTGQTGASPFPMYKFGIPITLNPFESFTIQMNWDGSPAINQEIDILLVLHAFMRRPT